MTLRLVVLDAAGLDEVHSSRALRALLRDHAEHGGTTAVSAVTIAEVARGRSRTAIIQSMLRQRHGGQSIRIQVTDEKFACLVGSLLHAAHLGSEAIADAHVVATCATAEVSLVVTSDSDDIRLLAECLPGVRIRTVRPDLVDR